MASNDLSALEKKHRWSRRSVLQAAPGLFAGVSAYSVLGSFAEAAERVRTKIKDIRTMEIEQAPGVGRTYVFVKIIADNGEFGIAEGYGIPNVGLVQQVELVKPLLVGRDPLEMDKIYTFLGVGTRSLSGARTDGSSHGQMRLASMIDMALWDLAGKLLNVPTTVLLGGRFRDKVRVYDHSGPADMLDKASCRKWAEEANAHPSGFTMHKIGLVRTAVMGRPGRPNRPEDVNHDPSNRELTTKELLFIGKSFENAREAIGWDHDIIVHAHWELNLSSAIQLAKILEPMRPLALEDPLQVDYSNSWKRLVDESPIPILMGENTERRQGFQPFFENGAIDIIQPDLRNSGGFIESKKIADMADMYGIPVCNHNTGSPVSTMQTCQWAGAIKEYLACEVSNGDGGWIDDVIIHDGKYIDKGYVKINDKPGSGIVMNRKIVEPHLVSGSKWWGD